MHGMPPLTSPPLGGTAVVVPRGTGPKPGSQIQTEACGHLVSVQKYASFELGTRSFFAQQGLPCGCSRCIFMLCCGYTQHLMFVVDKPNPAC